MLQAASAVDTADLQWFIWPRCCCRQHTSDPVAAIKVQAVARQLLSCMRYCHMTGNFLAAVAQHHRLLASQPEIARWLVEAMQWAKASKPQQEEMQVRQQ